MISSYFSLALRNLRKRRLRSWLTMLGIVIAIASVFMLISLSLGLQNAIKLQFQQLGADKFFVFPSSLMLAGPGAASQSEDFTIKDAEVVEKVNGIDSISYFTFGNAEVEYKDKKRFLLVIGVPTDDLSAFSNVEAYKAEEGRFFEEGDKGEIVIGNSFKTEKVYGEKVHVSDKLTINGKQFKIKAILATLGNPSDDKNILMPYSDFKELFNSGDRIDEIFVKIETGENIKEVAERTEKALLKNRDLTKDTKDFSITTPEELLESVGTILNIITGFLLAVAAISLLVGGIGIANTMYASTLERTREIGTMKAVGAKNSDILLIFLIESGLLGLIGGFLGVILGIAVSKTIEFIASAQLGVSLLKSAAPFYLIIGCLAFAFIVGAVSGIWPAYKASKLSAVDALRYE